MNMFTRTLETSLKAAAHGYPVLTVLGPRQSGKTTLAVTAFPDKPYVSLENPDTRERIAADPRGFLAQYPAGAILDEVQRLPELLSYLQGIVDAPPPAGTADTGPLHLDGQLSECPEARRRSDSRRAYGHLPPVCLLPSVRWATRAGLSICGTRSRPALSRACANENWSRHSSIRATLRPSWSGISALRYRCVISTSFGTSCDCSPAGVGQLVNFSSLGNDLGASANTMRHWLSVLEASWLIFQLPPWFENFGKRVVKSPKVYFTDTGLACALLGIETPAQLSRDPTAGGLVENWAILEYLKTCWNSGRDARIHFFRDRHGSEVDLLLSRGHELVPIEIKSRPYVRSDAPERHSSISRSCR